MRIYFILYLLLILLLHGCSHPSVVRDKTYFSYDIVKDYHLNNENINSVQFFTSEDIRLTKVTTSSDVRYDYSQAKKITANTSINDVINIPQGTPGVATSIDNEGVAIDFGDDIKIKFPLIFNLYYIDEYSKPSINNIQYDVSVLVDNSYEMFAGLAPKVKGGKAYLLCDLSYLKNINLDESRTIKRNAPGKRK